jgi:hypothetical protein
LTTRANRGGNTSKKKELRGASSTREHNPRNAKNTLIKDPFEISPRVVDSSIILLNGTSHHSMNFISNLLLLDPIPLRNMSSMVSIEEVNVMDGYVGSRTRDRAKAEPGLVKKIADPAIFNQSSGKSVSYSHTNCVGQAKHLKIRSLLHLTSKG